MRGGPALLALSALCPLTTSPLNPHTRAARVPTPPPDFIQFYCDDCKSQYNYPSNMGNPQAHMTCSCGAELKAENGDGP